MAAAILEGRVWDIYPLPSTARGWELFDGKLQLARVSCNAGVCEEHAMCLLLTALGFSTPQIHQDHCVLPGVSLLATVSPPFSTLSRQMHGEVAPHHIWRKP